MTPHKNKGFSGKPRRVVKWEFKRPIHSMDETGCPAYFSGVDAKGILVCSIWLEAYPDACSLEWAEALVKIANRKQTHKPKKG